jgi:LPS sulfotransferase NodH
VLAVTQCRTQSYLICSSPRSGSWLLSEGLASTARAGNPREWFNVLEEQSQKARFRSELPPHSPYSKYLDHVLTIATTSNGVCGIKVHYYQFAELWRKLTEIDEYGQRPIASLMTMIFGDPKYIWLKRRDKARQAISYYRACKTDEWWQIDGVSRPPGAVSAHELPFDPGAIRGLEVMLDQNDERWDSYFKNNGIEPLVLEYEELADDYAGSIARVLDWLEIPGVERITPPRLKRQADGQTDEWLVRYRRFKHTQDRAELVNGKAAVNSIEASTGNTNEGALALPVGSPLFERFREPQAAVTGKPTPDANKPRRFLDALQRMSRLGRKSIRIDRCAALSRQQFLEDYYAANKPVVMTGLSDSWPALKLWTADYLKAAIGDAEVEIMASREADPRCDMNLQQHRSVVRFGEYVDKVFGGGATNDYYLVANNHFFRRPQCRRLLDDLTVFEEYLDPAALDDRCFLWLGPGGTVTPLHHDACNIMMAQVSGRKHFHIVPAEQWQYLYNTTSYWSDVDCEKPDFLRWPQFRHATVIELTLEPGEVMFMPVGWWHHVRTLEPSAMISFTNFVFPNSFEW